MKNEEAVQRLVALKEFSSEHDLKNIGKALDMAYTALEVTSRAWIEKSWKGEWIIRHDKYNEQTFADCSKCKERQVFEYFIEVKDFDDAFCPHCGAPMTDKAVDLVMERFKKYNDLCGEVITLE